MSTSITALSLSIDNDRTTAILTDNNSTVTTLNNYAAFVQGFKVSYNSSESPLTFTMINSNYPAPYADLLTAKDGQWQFTYNTDGWYKFRYIAAPVWVSLTSYSQYDIVYDATVDAFYQADLAYSGASAPSAVPASFTQVTDLEAVLLTIGTATDPGNIYYEEFDTITRVNTNKGFGDAAIVAALELCGDCTRTEDVELYELLGVMVDAMALADGRDYFVKGEKISRRAERLI